MIKKGFSLVELAIVLVIIGILAGMTIKGKSLIDSAKVQRDLAKIFSVQAEVIAVLANGLTLEKGRFYPVSEIIQEKDAAFITSTFIGTTLKFRIAKITKNDKVPGTHFIHSHVTPAETGFVAMWIAPEYGKQHIGCHYDVRFDDGDPGRGDVMFVSNLSYSGKAFTALECNNSNAVLLLSSHNDAYIDYGVRFWD